MKGKKLKYKLEIIFKKETWFLIKESKESCELEKEYYELKYFAQKPKFKINRIYL